MWRPSLSMGRARVARRWACVLCLLSLSPACLEAQETALAEGAGQSDLSGDPRYPAAADGGLGSTMTLQVTESPVASNAAEKEILTLQAASESVPALKYRLWVPDYELQAGRAQTYFGRALLLWQQFPVEDRSRIIAALDEESAPSPRLEQDLENLSRVFDELHRMAECEDQTFGLRLRDLHGPSLYQYLLPEVQESRDLARLLVLRFRQQVQQADVAGAVGTLQVGFRLAHFVGQGETLVQYLVGLAIQGIMLEETTKLLELDDSPNLYWPLASLPRPLNRVQNSIQFELGAVHRVLPMLAQAEEGGFSDAYWDSAWTQLVDDLNVLQGTSGQEEFGARIALSVFGVAAAGPAKERLIAGGVPADEVARMPALRAVLMDASRELRYWADNLGKGGYLPADIALAVNQQTLSEFDAWHRENSLRSGAAMIAGMLLPATQAASAASLRQEFKLARLMNVEAIRNHIAITGQPPKQLDDLQLMRALRNPFDNRAFEYHFENRSGGWLITLSGDLPETSGIPRDLQFFVQKPQR